MQQRVYDYIHANWSRTIKSACESDDTLIGLPYPYTTPCISGMFQELYYWDTYFTNVGLLMSDMTDQAKHNIDNMIYLINTYGKMPNGNRTYYLNRSQPPFLSQMVRELFEVTHDKQWLAEHAYGALEIEYVFWEQKRQPPLGLNRYGCDLTKDEDYEDIAAYFSDRISKPLPVDRPTRIQWGKSMMALAESGWDCTSRFALNAHEHIPCDLNSLLYQFEQNMAYFAEVLQKQDDVTLWTQRAQERQDRMTALLWSEERHVFCDRNAQTDTLNHMVSAAAFYPLFTKLATAEQAAATVRALPLLECEHGIACCEARDDLLSLQWDYPHGWACLHYIVIKGLLHFGYTADAKRIAEKYVRTVARNFETTDNLWEKYNVVTGEISATREYDTPPMMGWSAGVYVYCYHLLNK